MVQLLKWAFQHKDSRNIKYQSRQYAWFAFLFGTSFFFIGMIGLEQLILINYPGSWKLNIPQYGNHFAVFLGLYLFAMIAIRYYQSGYIVLYQILWACNLCMILVIYGVFKKNKYLIGAALLTISTDQILWYVDLTSYIIFKKFKIGVAKYLLWPQTSKLRIASSFHHVWFIPLCLYFLKLSDTSVSRVQYYCALFVVTCLAFIGRYLSPREIILPSGKHIYMNINLAWQLWKDIPLKVFDGIKNSPFYVNFVVLITAWGSSILIFIYPIIYIQERLIL